MAGIVGLRKSAWDAASAPQKAVARMVFNELELGNPASGSIGGTSGMSGQTGGIDARFVAILSWVMTHLA